MTLCLPLDVLDAAASTSEGVGAVYDTSKLGRGLCAARHLIVEEVILGLLAESGVASGVAAAGVALTCTAPDTAPRLLFVTLGFLVRLFLEVEVLGRLAAGSAGNAVCSDCQEVGVFCASVCPDVGVFGVLSTLLFFDSHGSVSDMMRIDGRAARGSGQPSWSD